jgi:hypothetical protein
MYTGFIGVNIQLRGWYVGKWRRNFGYQINGDQLSVF